MHLLNVVVEGNLKLLFALLLQEVPILLLLLQIICCSVKCRIITFEHIADYFSFFNMIIYLFIYFKHNKSSNFYIKNNASF